MSAESGTDPILTRGRDDHHLAELERKVATDPLALREGWSGEAPAVRAAVATAFAEASSAENAFVALAGKRFMPRDLFAGACLLRSIAADETVESPARLMVSASTASCHFGSLTLRGKVFVNGLLVVRGDLRVEGSLVGSGAILVAGDVYARGFMVGGLVLGDVEVDDALIANIYGKRPPLVVGGTARAAAMVFSSASARKKVGFGALDAGHEILGTRLTGKAMERVKGALSESLLVDRGSAVSLNLIALADTPGAVRPSDARVTRGPTPLGQKPARRSEPKKKKNTPKKTGGPRYPFLFYGPKPRDWTDFGTYAVRFVGAVPTGDRRAIEEATRTWASGVGFASNRQAWIAVDAPAFAKAMRGLRRIHRIAAIAEVVNHAARDVSDHPWEKWTLKQQPEPSPELLDPDGVSLWSR